MKVKICGITNPEDALAAVEFGADALGFVFFKDSPRYIKPSDAASIIQSLPAFITTVGIFVDEPVDQMEKIIAKSGINVAQLHGDEPPSACGLSCKCIKAIRVKSLDSLSPLASYRGLVSAFLLDTYSPEQLGGTGRMFNWDIAIEAKQFGKIILAGGLTVDNIIDAIRHVKPYAVDVSSGVEASKGKKDHDKMRRFIELVKSV